MTAPGPQAAFRRAPQPGSSTRSFLIKIKFLTPNRLTFEGRPATAPEFHILVRNLLRRVSSLCYFHHGFAYAADFPAIIEEAARVKLRANHTRWFEWERYSSRQAKKVPLGGLVGEALYAGPVVAFWPLLRLGELLHVGKGTVFGQGKFVVTREPVGGGELVAEA